MALHVTCTACQASLEIDDEHAGWRVRCPRCQVVFLARDLAVAVGAPASPWGSSPTPPGASTTPVTAVSPPPQLSAAVPPSTPPVSWPSPATPAPAAAPEAQKDKLPTHSLANWSLGLAILGIMCMGWTGSLPAIICGAVALKKMKEEPGRWSGESYAWAGIVIAILSLIMSAKKNFRITGYPFENFF